MFRRQAWAAIVPLSSSTSTVFLVLAAPRVGCLTAMAGTKPQEHPSVPLGRKIVGRTADGVDPLPAPPGNEPGTRYLKHGDRFAFRPRLPRGDDALLPVPA